MSNNALNALKESIARKDWEEAKNILHGKGTSSEIPSKEDCVHILQEHLYYLTPDFLEELFSLEKDRIPDPEAVNLVLTNAIKNPVLNSLVIKLFSIVVNNPIDVKIKQSFFLKIISSTLVFFNLEEIKALLAAAASIPLPKKELIETLLKNQQWETICLLMENNLLPDRSQANYLIHRIIYDSRHKITADWICVNRLLQLETVYSPYPLEPVIYALQKIAALEKKSKPGTELLCDTAVLIDSIYSVKSADKGMKCPYNNLSIEDVVRKILSDAQKEGNTEQVIKITTVLKKYLSTAEMDNLKTEVPNVLDKSADHKVEKLQETTDDAKALKAKRQDELLQKQKKYIKDRLKDFNLELNEADTVRLEHDSNPIPSNYLDTYLLPKIPKKYGGSPQILEHFQSLVDLALRGNVSMQFWDVLWSVIPESYQLHYATYNYRLGTPLKIAATHYNLNGLKKLDLIYSSLLQKYPKYRSQIHRDLVEALKNCNLFKHKEPQSIPCFEVLLTMVKVYSFNEETKDPGFMNKKLDFRDNGVMYELGGSTTLAELYYQLADHYLYTAQWTSFSLLCEHLADQIISKKQFEQFKDHVLDFIKNELPKGEYNLEFRQKIPAFLELNQNKLIPKPLEETEDLPTSNDYEELNQKIPALLELNQNKLTTRLVKEKKQFEEKKKVRKEENDQKIKVREELVQSIQKDLDIIFNQFANTVCGIQNHHVAKAAEVANTLLIDLEEAKTQYLTELSQIDTKVSERNALFYARCESLIHEALPEFEKDVSWGTYLLNMLRQIANVVLYVVSFGHTSWNFFPPVRSELASRAEEVCTEVKGLM